MGAGTRSAALASLMFFCLTSLLAASASASFMNFRPSVQYPTGQNPRAVWVGDLDGDSCPDLAVANSADNDISVFINKGDGTFRVRSDFSTAGSCYSVTGADIDRDGKVDLVAADYDTAEAAVLKGNGDGTFGMPVRYPVGAGARHIVARDLNRDGKLDLVVTGYKANCLSLLLGNGDGTFRPRTDMSTGFSPRASLVADLNRDGRDDIVVLNSMSHSLTFFSGNGDGTFRPGVETATGQAPRSLAAADLDDDGYLDLVTANQWSGDLSVLPGNGDGTFRSRLDYPLYLANSVVDGDFDRDGREEIALTGGDEKDYQDAYVAFFDGHPDGSLQRLNQLTLSGVSGSFSMAAGDFDRDGRLDLVTTNYSDTLSVFLGYRDRELPDVGFAGEARAEGAYLKGAFNLPVIASDTESGVARIQMSGGAAVDFRHYLTGSFTSTCSFTIDSTVLGGGRWSCNLSAQDGAGNVGTASRYYFIDNTRPKTYAPAKAVVKRYAKTRLYYRVDDRHSPSAAVTIKIRNSRGTVVTAFSRVWRPTGVLAFATYKAALPKGTYRYCVYAVDRAGNVQDNVAGNSLVIK